MSKTVFCRVISARNGGRFAEKHRLDDAQWSIRVSKYFWRKIGCTPWIGRCTVVHYGTNIFLKKYDELVDWTLHSGPLWYQYMFEGKYDELVDWTLQCFIRVPVCVRYVFQILMVFSGNLMIKYVCFQGAILEFSMRYIFELLFDRPWSKVWLTRPPIWLNFTTVI